MQKHTVNVDSAFSGSYSASVLEALLRFIMLLLLAGEFLPPGHTQHQNFYKQLELSPLERGKFLDEQFDFPAAVS